MGKIHKNFYPQIYDLFNLWQAFAKASKGRRSHPSVAAFEYNLETELIRLRDELRDETYLPGGIVVSPCMNQREEKFPPRRFGIGWYISVMP